MANADHRPGSKLTRSHLRIYRQIANGTTGAFMAPADVCDLLDEIDRLETSSNRTLDVEAANLDGMGEASHAIALRYRAQGDEVACAFWRGRARGLQLAAHNLHLSPTLPLTEEELQQQPPSQTP